MTPAGALLAATHIHDQSPSWENIHLGTTPYTPCQARPQAFVGACVPIITKSLLECYLLPGKNPCLTIPVLKKGLYIGKCIWLGKN